MKHTFFFFFVLISLGSVILTFAACDGFDTKSWVPQLGDYIHNGLDNSEVFAPGETGELEFSVFPNNNYKVMVCAQEHLGKIEFNIKDEYGKLIFNNKSHNLVNSWIFTSKSTQKLIFEMTVPPAAAGATTNKSGCVSILIGYKEIKN